MNEKLLLLLLFALLSALPFSLSFCLLPSSAPQRAFSKSSTKHLTPITTLSAALLEFQEPSTNVTVVLVGTMHYNPASIQLATDTIDRLGQAGALGSVVVESCDVRWKAAEEMNPALRKILKSEMKAACDAAIAYQRPVVLGDQRINITSDRLKAAVKQTVMDLLSPPGGWKQIYGNLTQAWNVAVPSGDDDYLSLGSFFNPQLISVAPVSLFKYPLSFLIKSPFPSTALLAFFILTNPGSAPYDELTILDWLASLPVFLLEVVLFGRVLLKELLEDRNEILARQILQQCRRYGNRRKTRPWLPPLWLGREFSSEDEYSVVYVSNSNTSRWEAGEDATVVAVLGMAHCNGIMKLLKEQRL